MSQTGQRSTAPLNETPFEGNDSAYELDLTALWYRIVEKWIIIVATTVVSTALALVISIEFLTPIYTATAKLYVLSPGDSVINLSDLQIGSYLTRDYKEVFYTWEVNEQVANNLQLNYTGGQLQNMVSVENPSDTRILCITVESHDAEEAMLIANEYARVAQTYISSTMSTEKPSLLSSAKVPDSPSGPNKKRNVILGFLAGIAASVGFVVVRFIFDDRIKTTDDIRTYGRMTTLAIIPVSESYANARPTEAQDRRKQYRDMPEKRRA